MMLGRTSAVIAILLAHSFLCGAAYAACPGETQMELNECAGMAYQKADKQLNQAYRKLQRTPDLVAAQRAWITFRDAECKYQASGFDGGSIQPMVYANCLQSLTEDRIKQLEQASQEQ